VSLGAAVACVVPVPARGGFESTIVRCDDGKPIATSPASSPPTLVDTWTSLDLTRPDGSESRVLAMHEPSGTLHVTQVGVPESLTLNDTGAQVALADLDQDGAPEVITTAAHGEDALVIASWQKGGLVPRLRWAAPAGVDAVAVCPAEADDAPSVVAAVGSEIWLVH
jgi:hypothetical protein